MQINEKRTQQDNRESRGSHSTRDSIMISEDEFYQSSASALSARCHG